MFESGGDMRDRRREKGVRKESGEAKYCRSALKHKERRLKDDRGGDKTWVIRKWRCLGMETGKKRRVGAKDHGERSPLETVAKKAPQYVNNTFEKGEWN